MGILSALFPSADVAGSVFKGATKLIDDAFYTDQEKAEDAVKAKQAAFNQYLKWMEATSGQNRARRAIAVVVTGLWATTWVLSLLVQVLRPWVPEQVQSSLQESGQALIDSGGDINGVFMIIIGFYFGGRLFGQHLDNKRDSK